MPESAFTVRPIRVPQDFAPVAEILNLVQDWPTTPADLERRERNREAKYHHAAFVAQVLEAGLPRVVGRVVVEHDSFSFEEGKFWFGIAVHPDYQRRGIGTALWQAGLQHLAPLEPRKLVNMVQSDSASGLGMLSKYGFQQTWERVESRLDPKSVDFRLYADLDATLEQSGVQIATLAELTRPDSLERLYALDVELMGDVPFGTSVTMPSFEQWHKEFTSDPRVRLDAVWVAYTGDEWLGFSSLDQHPTHFVIGMTGVKRAYRGRGIAKRLKLEGVKYALAHGGFEIRTYNDHVNQAMLEMNTNMGFKRYRSMLRFEKLL